MRSGIATGSTRRDAGPRRDGLERIDAAVHLARRASASPRGARHARRRARRSRTGRCGGSAGRRSSRTRPTGDVEVEQRRRRRRSVTRSPFISRSGSVGALRQQAERAGRARAAPPRADSRSGSRTGDRRRSAPRSVGRGSSPRGRCGVIPKPTRCSTIRSRIGRPATRSIGLGTVSVSGRSRTPWPPAMTTAQFVRSTRLEELVEQMQADGPADRRR